MKEKIINELLSSEMKLGKKLAALDLANEGLLYRKNNNLSGLRDKTGSLRVKSPSEQFDEFFKNGVTIPGTGKHKIYTSDGLNDVIKKFEGNNENVNSFKKTILNTNLPLY